MSETGLCQLLFVNIPAADFPLLATALSQPSEPVRRGSRVLRDCCPFLDTSQGQTKHRLRRKRQAKRQEAKYGSGLEELVDAAPTLAVGCEWHWEEGNG